MLFGKIKCPACGQKNDKSRMTCAACGAPLFLDKEDETPPSVPPVAREAPPPAEVAAAAAPPKPATAPPGDKSVLFSCRVANGDSEVAITGEKLTFKEGKKLTEIPLPNITGFEYHLNLTAITSSVAKPMIGHVSVDYTNADGKNKDLGFHLTRDKIELLQHWLYKQTAGRYIDTDESRLKWVHQLTSGVARCLLDAGLDVRLAVPKQLEEKIGDDYCLGVIAIAEGPIRWASIRTTESEETIQNPLLKGLAVVSQYGSASGALYYAFTESKRFYVNYGIPDVNMPPDYPLLKLYLAENNGGLAWTGNEDARAIVSALNARPGLLSPNMNPHNISITPYPQYSSWVITIKGTLIQDSNLWGCFRDIAEIMLSATEK